MTSVYIQVNEDRQFINVNAFAAYLGFYERGYEVHAFTYEELPLLPLTKDTIVHGGIQTVKKALEKVGAPLHRFETYPYPLRKFLDRDPIETTLEKVMHAFQHMPHKQKVCFIKPSHDAKAFSGMLVEVFSDLLKIMHVDPETRIYKLHPVKFLSEYRIFVHKGEMIGMRHYRGDPLIFPDAAVIKKLLFSAKNGMPEVAYSLDVGVAYFPERPELIRYPTILVEANDAHSLGAYGLSPHLYAQMIEDRWNQLVAHEV